MYQGKFEAKNRPNRAVKETDSQTAPASQSVASRAQAPSARPQNTGTARQQMPGVDTGRLPGARSAVPAQSNRPAAPNQAPRPAPQKPVPVAEPKRKGPRLGGVIFYTVYFLFIFLFFGGMFFVLQWLNGWLGDYEAAQPTVKCQEVFDSLFGNPDWGALYDMAGIQDTAYEGKEEYVAYMQNKVAGQPLNFAETSAGLSGDKKYFVRLGDEKIASFTLKGEAEKITDIPDWELGAIELFFDRQEGYLIEKLDGHTAYVNGVALDDSFTIQTASTSAEQYLPIGVTGAKTCIQSITGLMVKPEVTVVNQAGEQMEVTYNEETGTFVEQTESNTISEAEQTLAINALKAYGEYMIKASNARVGVAKYFDSSSNAYNNIISMGSELWMNKDYGHRFLDEKVSDYCRYTDELFSVRASVTMNVTLKDGNTRDYSIDQALFFRKKNGNWVCYEMTNEDVTKPVGKVRITFINDGTTLSSEFYDTNATSLMAPVVATPEGKVFTGWVKEEVNNGVKELTVVFTPDESGLVTIGTGVTLEPMTLYALFEDPQ